MCWRLAHGTVWRAQERTARYLAQLSTSYTLALSAHRAPAAAGGGGAAIERITKAIRVQPGLGLSAHAAGEPRERSLRQLSGGERRRVALALALGFAELVAARGRLRCNLIVLDEVRRCQHACFCAP